MKSTISLTTVQVRDAVRGFNSAQLESLQELIAALLESKAKAATADAGDSKTTKAGRPRKPRNSVPFIEVKTIKGHQYQYKRWYENGKLRSEYIGKAEAE
jgi:hypothetical protein